MKIALVLLLLLLTGCSLCIEGSGEVVSEEVSVDYFDAVNLMGSGTLYITQQDENSLVVEAEDNIFENMDIYILDNVLMIDQKSCVRETKPIRFRIGMNDVREITVSGSGKIISENEISSPDLTIEIAGSGDIDMSLRVKLLETIISGSGDASYTGMADRHAYTLSGSGKLHAFDLKTANTNVVIAGSGDASVSASQNLDVKVSGSGDVTYKGDADVTQSVSGSGKVSKSE